MTIEKFPIESSHVMMFARSIGDPNPIYYDAAYAESTELARLLAPPTFVQASAQFDPDYEMRPKSGEAWPRPAVEDKLIDADAHVGARLQAGQYFEYHKQLFVGDVLFSKLRPGRQWVKDKRRGGKLLFVETVSDFYNQHKELVITATNVVVYLEKKETFEEGGRGIHRGS